MKFATSIQLVLLYLLQKQVCSIICILDHCIYSNLFLSVLVSFCTSFPNMNLGTTCILHNINLKLVTFWIQHADLILEAHKQFSAQYVLFRQHDYIIFLMGYSKMCMTLHTSCLSSVQLVSLAFFITSVFLRDLVWCYIELS